jgi:antitoxin component of MazEF toxin-antitoxin module
MSVRKQEDKNIRKITRVGGTSLAVTLPIELVRDLKWKEKQRVVVKRIKGGLVIRGYRRNKFIVSI